MMAGNEKPYQGKHKRRTSNNPDRTLIRRLHPYDNQPDTSHRDQERQRPIPRARSQAPIVVHVLPYVQAPSTHGMTYER